MIYAGRLMGMLNLERPEAERFPPEFVLTPQLLALHSRKRFSNSASICSLENPGRG